MARPLSPLKSPIMRRHLMEDIDIHYPSQFLTQRPIYKQNLIGDDGFRAAIDVHDFENDEVSVKTVGHTIIVKCAHDEKDDGHGGITRSFTKKYVLPLDLDIDKIDSYISSAGILYLKVPPKATLESQIRVVDVKVQE